MIADTECGGCRRKNFVQAAYVTSQRVDVALVFQSMLGTDAANAYLRTTTVPAWVAARILTSSNRRASLALAVE